MFFKGLIVNNVDESNARRVQVRVLSIHPMADDENYNLVPDECLPWARPAIPITAGKTSGNVGEFDVPDVDDWVWLFFEDDEFQRPVYFAIIVTDVDVDDSFSPGENKISNDKWGNTIIRDAGSIKIIKNNGSIIDMNDDGINIITESGNSILLSDADKKITFKDVSGNIIETTKDNIICKNSDGKGIDVSGNIINLVSGSEREPAIYGAALVEWLASHTHTSSYPTSPTSPPVPDQLINLKDILHLNTMYNDGKPFEVSKEDDDVVNNRLGEEEIVFGSYAEQSYNSGVVAELMESGVTKDDAFKQLDDLNIKQQEAFSAISELEDLPPIPTTTQFDAKYPILKDPFDGDKFAEAKFVNKLGDFTQPLKEILIEARKRYRFIITEGFRTAEYQRKLYNKGLTPCDGDHRKSKHQGNGSRPITCVDISPQPGGTGNRIAMNQLYEVMMSVARFKGVGLRWLGNVRMPNGAKDKCHWELI